ncbi:MAG: phytanoyl-CoA dioxygenase family protein [Chitinophagales bacterium]|nr:phytanoyl-CoA dioxygenase family protein [Chitinophagales bacterium]
MKDIVVNSETKAQLENDGFAVVPFLNSEELSALQHFYSEVQASNFIEFFNSMHMTTFSANEERKFYIKGVLEKLLSEPTKRTFKNCRMLNNIFIIKQANSGGYFNMHSDWSVVDESQFASYNVWIPLQDTQLENGTLWVIKGSHKLNMPHRGGGKLLHMFNYSYNDVKDKATIIPLKAGEAVLFNLKTIHGSFPNSTNQNRCISSFTVIPTEAPLQISFQENESSPLLLIEPQDDFMYRYSNILTQSNQQPPNGRLIASLPNFTVALPSLNDILSI